MSAGMAVEVDQNGLSLFLDYSRLDHRIRVPAAKASPFVVAVVSRNLPVDMAVPFGRPFRLPRPHSREHVFWQTGTIIECAQDSVTGKFLTTIIVAASIFVRNNGVQPHQIRVDVYLSDGKLCEAKVVACDYHYNLAAVTIHTDFPLPTPPLRMLNDIVPIINSPFQLLPHSDLFEVSPGTPLITLGRSFKGDLQVHSGVFSATCESDCNDLYGVQNCNIKRKVGGPVINFSGEVTGIMFYDSPFLPINIVSRWWNFFKSYGKYRRPWCGVEIGNLYSSRVKFLEEFMMKFPGISVGVVVAKVVEESPAYCSGIQAKDVIIKCDGESVRSKLEFLEILWDKVGETVELDILRSSIGDQLKLSLTVGETSPENFYHWKAPLWWVLDKDGRAISTQ